MTDVVLKKMQLVFKKEDLARITPSKSKENQLIVDLHGLGTKDSLVLLNNIININRDACDIKVIHGYNHGTALKDMINGRFVNTRILDRVMSESNPGVTMIRCAAAV